MIRRSGKGTGRNLWARIGWVFFLWVLLFGLGVTSATAAPKAEAWTFWAANDPAGQVRVDHGPWGAKLLTIQGQKVSLDDIEHRILRPLWKDNRVHYAVNCASLGCPPTKILNIGGSARAGSVAARVRRRNNPTPS